MKKTENKSGKSGMQVMKKLMAFIGNYKIFLGLSIVLAAVTVILQLYIPILFGDAIDEVVAAHQVNFPEMWFYLKRIVFFTLVSALSAWIMNLINNRMTYRIVRDLRSQAIRHIQVLPLSYLDQHSSGDIVSRVIADTDILSDGLLLGFTQLFSGIVTIIVTLFFMFSKNVWITLLVICLTPLSFFVAKFISGRSFKMFQKQSETRGKQTALIDEMIGNQKVVKAFGYEEKASERFAEINKDLQKYSQQAVFYSSLTNPSTRFVNNVIYAGVALVGAFMIPGGALTVGGLSVLLLLPKGGLQTTVMFALAAWLVIYGLFLTRRLLRAYHRVIRIFDDTRADDIGAYIKWLSIFTYWAVTFGVGCGLLTFLPDEYIYIWILSSVPFYIYLFLCYLNYLLFYEQVENAMEDGMTSEEEDLCDTTNREQAQRQDTPFFHAEMAKKIKGWIDADGYIRPGLTIKELSDVLHTNRTNLSAYIKTTYKMTFREWITGLRLEYAKNILKEHPEINIQKLAESSGFLSRSNFIKSFTEKEGCTPGKWKKANLE
mgnify:CR=1 FL=1